MERSTSPTRPRSVRLLFFNLALPLVAASIPCLAAEAVLRLLAFPSDTPGLFLKVASEVEWSGRPSSRGMFAGVPVAFNSLGLRDRERSMQRTPGTKRILMLGDSMTFGMGVAEEETFPRVTEGLLNASQTRGQAPVEILNFSLPGYNTLHELAQLKELGLAFHPDVVVVGFFYNDVELSTVQGRRLARTIPAAAGVAGPPSLPRRVWLDVDAGVSALQHRSLLYAWVASRLGAAIRQLGAKGFGQVGKINDQYVDSNQNWQLMQAALLEMKRLCEQRDIQLVIAIIPAMARFTESGYPIKAYHEAVSGFCRAQSITCLDLLPAFWGLDGTKFWISLTDGHPDARGHRIIAEALARFLVPLLRPRSVGVPRYAAR